MANRIDEHCWWKKIDLKAGTQEWRKATLRAWGTDYEQFESGPGLFPVGVVEDHQTALVHSVPVHLLSFVSDQPPINEIVSI